ncbi:MAG TPA: 4Fe-4S binding protein [Acidimicrobiales bacterium]|jgi:NAD-dependent dihydropyrimidine dehydrogenase PreA subunit
MGDGQATAEFGDEPVPAGAARRTNPAKVKQARANPNRPGEKCRAEPGRFIPVIDHGRCEGKRDCVEVCPYDVFEVSRISNADFGALGVLNKLKSVAHQRHTAYAVRADACHACGLCVVACPESAITLMPAAG